MMKKRFKKIYVEITNVCNLACAFCPPTARPKAFMPPEAFERLLDSIRPWTDYVYLHVKGEPLLHPKLDQLLSLAQAEGFYVNLTTNGTLLGKMQDTLLSHPVRQVNISLHSFEANELGSQSFEDYIMSTFDFAKRFSPAHGITCFRLWNLNPNQMTAPQREKNALILEQLSRYFHCSEDLDYRDYTHSNVCLDKRIYLSFDHQFQWPSLAADDFGPTGSCQGLRSHIAILCDGTVVPCCLDGDGIVALGNIFQTPLEAILDSPRSQSMTQGFKNNKICEELCRRCGYRTRF